MECSTTEWCFLLNIQKQNASVLLWKKYVLAIGGLVMSTRSFITQKSWKAEQFYHVSMCVEVAVVKVHQLLQQHQLSSTSLMRLDLRNTQHEWNTASYASL